MQDLNFWEEIMHSMTIDIDSGMFVVYLNHVRIINYRVARSSNSAMFGEKATVPHFKVPQRASIDEILDNLRSPVAMRRLAIYLEYKYLNNDKNECELFANLLRTEGKITLLNNDYEVQIENSFRNNVFLIRDKLLILKKNSTPICDVVEIISLWRRHFFKLLISELQEELELQFGDKMFVKYKVSVTRHDKTHMWEVHNLDCVHVSVNCCRFDREHIMQALMYFNFVMQGYSRKESARRCRRLFIEFDYANIMMCLEYTAIGSSLSYFFLVEGDINSMSVCAETRERFGRMTFLDKNYNTHDVSTVKLDKLVNEAKKTSQAEEHMKKAAIIDAIKKSNSL